MQLTIYLLIYLLFSAMDQCGKFVFVTPRFTPCQLSKDNRPIVLLLFLMFFHANDIWRNIHVFQRGLWKLGNLQNLEKTLLTPSQLAYTQCKNFPVPGTLLTYLEFFLNFSAVSSENCSGNHKLNFFQSYISIYFIALSFEQKIDSFFIFIHIYDFDSI